MSTARTSRPARAKAMESEPMPQPMSITRRTPACTNRSAWYHADRFVQAGVRRVIDIGCGIGSDSMAFARAGLEVLAVDIDPVTAVVAQANLADRANVICADANEMTEQLTTHGVGIFCDPSRRDDRGRVWRVEDFAPSWSFVTHLLDGDRTAGVKLGPALPHSLIPVAVEAEWITHRGETVEVGLWAGPGATPGRRSALIMPDARLTVTGAAALPVRDLGRYIYEPAGAVIRAGAVAELGERVAAEPQSAAEVGPSGRSRRSGDQETWGRYRPGRTPQTAQIAGAEQRDDRDLAEAKGFHRRARLEVVKRLAP